MSEIEIKIPGKIRGKQRVRVTNKRAFTPEQTVNYENMIKMCFLEKYSSAFAKYSGPVKMTISCFFAMPKSWSEKKKSDNINDYCLKKPDLDNIAKIVGDALNGIAYVDDSQISMLICLKFWDEDEYLKITVEYLEES